MVGDAEANAEADKAKLLVIEARNDLEGYLYNVRNSLRDEKVQLGPNDKDRAEAFVTDHLAWLDEHREEDVETYKERKAAAEKDLMPIMMKLHASQTPSDVDGDEKVPEADTTTPVNNVKIEEVD